MPFLSTTGHSGRRAEATGLYPDDPGESAKQLKAINGHNTNGVYYISVNGVSTPTYCIMDSNISGGGWMMIMKATAGTTFQYSSNYWTTNNTLNLFDVTNNNADAKFNTFNYSKGTDLLAHFPDISQGGSLSVPGYGWTWYQPNFGTSAGLPTGNQPISALTLFNQTPLASGNAGTQNWGGRGWFIKDAKAFDGWGSAWSSQTDVRFYGFNYISFQGVSGTYTAAQFARTRWGFGFNENGEGLWPGAAITQYAGSNDISNGIGLDTGYNNYSAGDVVVCCNDTLGINRSARVEMYIR
jgi:hypothetical protein